MILIDSVLFFAIPNKQNGGKKHSPLFKNYSDYGLAFGHPLFIGLLNVVIDIRSGGGWVQSSCKDVQWMVTIFEWLSLIN